MSEQDVLTDERNGVLTLTLNRPESLNAISLEMLRILNREVYRARFDKGVRVVVLQGAGGCFCSGADMDLLEATDEATLGRQLFVNLDIARNVVRMEKPLVTKIRGHAAGAGCSLALLGDFAVAAEDATLLMTFTRLGAIPDMGATYVLPRLVGMAHAKAIAVLGEPVAGREAADLGLIYKAVPSADLDAAVDSLVERLLRLSPEAIGIAKRGLDQAVQWNIDETVDWEMSQQIRLIPGEYVQSQVRAFLAKRRGI